MSFKIRDLMISVLPGEAGAGARPDGCRVCTGTTNEPLGVGGCPACTGTVNTTPANQAAAAFCPAHTVGCTICTGTVPPTHHHYQGCWGGTGNGCPTCTGTTGPQAYWGPPDNGCIACTGTTGMPGAQACWTGTGTGNGCMACTGTTHDALAAQAAAVLACTVCSGASPQLANRLPQAITLLRQQLQGLLAEVEAEEKRIDAELFPKTAEEAEDLEKKLEDALAEVRTRKGGLPKKG